MASTRGANAVPPVTGTELGNLLDDLAGFDEGIDLIRDGIRHIASKNLTADRTQTLCTALAGSADGTDVLTALALLVARISNSATNPALRALDEDQQKTAAFHGEQLVYALTDEDLHQHASEASAAITGD